jgi:hypothetical protein
VKAVAVEARGTQQPACETRVTFAVIGARADCFRREGSAFVSDGPVRMNGITFNPIAGRPLQFDPSRRSISLGPIQLRVGSIVLYRGDLAWTVPVGDRVTLARVNLGTRSIVGAPPDDTEAALDLEGDDSANVQGFDLKGEVLLERDAGPSPSPSWSTCRRRCARAAARCCWLARRSSAPTPSPRLSPSGRS